MNLPPSGPPGLDACVAPLLEALGWQGNPSTLAEHLPSEAGWEAPELLDRLAELGWTSEADRFHSHRSADQILLVRDRRGAWACLAGPVTGGQRTFLPGEGGWTTVGFRDWRRRFRGGWTFAFEAAPADPTVRVSPHWIPEFISRHRKALTSALLYSLVLAGFGILSPQFIGLLYQQITSMPSTDTLVSLGLGALLFVVGEVLFLTLRQGLLSRLNEDVAAVLGREVVRRILRFPLAMSLNLEASVQYSRIREFEELANLLSRPVFRSMIDLPFMAVLLVFLGLTGGLMVLVPVVTILLFLLASAFAHPLLKKLEQDASEAQKRIQDELDVLLEKGQELKLLGLDAYWKTRAEQTELRELPAVLAKGRAHSLFQYFGSGAVSLAGVAAVLAGVAEVLGGGLPPGALMASMMLVWRILDPFRSIFVLLGSLENAFQTLGRLGKFMSLPGEERLDPARPPLHLTEPGLRVEGLYYKYPTSPRFALANVGFSVPAFGSLHIGGPAGAGKTTLALAVLGLVEGSSGRITVGDRNIRQFHSVSYRRALAHLPARVPILPATIRDNLRLARADADDAALMEALAEAGLAEVTLGLEHRLDTVLDAGFDPPVPDFFRGLGVARLPLRQSRLWILDAPEQGLGPELRRNLQDMLARRRGKITLLVFGSDPEFAALADQRSWLDQGRFFPEVP